MDLASLLSEQALAGRVPDDIDGLVSERIGRAVGTLAKRRGLLRATFLLSIEPGHRELSVVRDGLVRGLLQAGHDVTDVGPTSLAQHVSSLAHLEDVAGARIGWQGTEGHGGVHLSFQLMSGRPLEGADLDELCTIAAKGDLSSGFGTLRVLDVDRLLREERALGVDRSSQADVFRSVDVG